MEELLFEQSGRVKFRTGSTLLIPWTERGFAKLNRNFRP
ncbi:hypothetical protein V6Z12_D09G058600 [Gossypium hirsutum]